MAVKRCKVCGADFMPISSLARVCSVPCAIADVKAKKIKEFRKETRERKRAIKTQGEWVQEVQVVFNKYIRHRDAHLPCISCGEYYAEPINGRLWDCGHFLPVGAYPELRFNELNAHRQHSRCNSGAAIHQRNDRSVSQQYRARLIAKIGVDLVDWLEGPQKPLKLQIDELQALKRYYKQRTKEILAQ